MLPVIKKARQNAQLYKLIRIKHFDIQMVI
jgi:hypothetical protein